MKDFWWLNKSDNDAFKIIRSPNDYYKNDYYDFNHHTTNGEIEDVVNNLKTDLPNISNIKNVLEIGSGAGFYTKEFAKLWDVTSVEGSIYGCNLQKEAEILPDNKIINHDIRKPLNLNKKFHLVICMEVAEHIEIPFSSILIENLTKHAYLVYFTFCEPRQKHIHHPNEQYLKFWNNLFEFYDFELFKRLNGEYHRAQGYIFRDKIHTAIKPKEQDDTNN